MKKSNKVLIFFSYRKHKTGYYHTLFNPLKQNEEKYGVELSQGSLKDLRIEIVDNHLLVQETTTGLPLDAFGYVRLELWLKSPQQALAAATYMDRHGIAFSGHEALSVLCLTKIGELVRMADNDLPLPRTFMSSYRETLAAFKKNPPMPFPLVAKAADAFGGNMNYLVKNYDELKEALTKHKEQFFVIQEFIPNDSDYRVLIMGGEIKLVMKRTRSSAVDSHLNNTSAGASGEFVPIESLSDEIRRDALKSAMLTRRSDFAGVDVMIDSDTGKHYILEVNDAPAIQTGADPERKTAVLMQHIKEQIQTP